MLSSVFTRKRVTIMAILLLIVPLLAACGPSRSEKVTEETYKMSFDGNRKQFPSGDLSFTVTNKATDQEHEFVIFKTDLPEDQLPLNSDGNVDEEGQGVTHIDELGGIKVGETQTLKINLPPGNYVAICNLPGHYKQGMHWGFTVTP